LPTGSTTGVVRFGPPQQPGAVVQLTSLLPSAGHPQIGSGRAEIAPTFLGQHLLVQGEALMVEIHWPGGLGVLSVEAMARRPAPRDYHGWVSQLGHSSRRQEAKLVLLGSGHDALPAIRRGLSHTDPMVRRQCVNLLDHLVDDDSVPDLVAAVEDPDTQVAARALHALACDRCKEGACRPGEDLWVPRALALLYADDADLRAAAIDALGRVVDRRRVAAEALGRVALGDPVKGLRGRARRFVPASASQGCPAGRDRSVLTRDSDRG